MFKIEKGIQPPPRRGMKYPFRDMVPGDSFVITCPKEDMLKIRRRVMASANKKLKIAIRKEESGLRVWLLAYKTEEENADGNEEESK